MLKNFAACRVHVASAQFTANNIFSASAISLPSSVRGKRWPLDYLLPPHIRASPARPLWHRRRWLRVR